MSNAKHAPGPWHVAEWEVRDNDGAIEAGGWQVVGADGYAINTCISEGDGDQEEANLHFIVRACNSHERLVASLDDARELLALNGINSTDIADYGNGRADDIIARIDEALMLARAE